MKNETKSVLNDKTIENRFRNRQTVAMLSKRETPKTRISCLKSLSTKLCCFCGGFLFGVLLALSLLAALEDSNSGRKGKAFRRNATVVMTTTVTSLPVTTSQHLRRTLETEVTTEATIQTPEVRETTEWTPIDDQTDVTSETTTVAEVSNVTSLEWPNVTSTETPNVTFVDTWNVTSVEAPNMTSDWTGVTSSDTLNVTLNWTGVTSSETPNVTSPTSLNVTSLKRPNVTSDEVNGAKWNASLCSESEFLCSNRCLSCDRVCDGMADCADADDERECGDCGSNHRCLSDGKCVARRQQCDGVWDCDDGSDESGCEGRECRRGELACGDGRGCIEGRKACDGTLDCGDRSDEIGCVESEKCVNAGKWACDGLCLEAGLRCDGIADCVNATDEWQCSAGQCLGFECQFSRQCLANESVCDGRRDCADGSDEWACVKSDALGRVFRRINGSWFALCSSTPDGVCGAFGRTEGRKWSVFGNESSVLARDLQSMETTRCLATLGVECLPPQCANNTQRAPPPVLVGQCEGHVVGGDWVLTSALCLQSLPLNGSRVETHFRWSHFRAFPEHDFALIRAKELKTETVCLPAHAMDASITCFVGDVAFELVESARCNRSDEWNGRITARVFCALRSQGEACVGRGRGLLCLSSESEWYLAGFVVHEYGCDHKGRPVHARHRKHATVFSNAWAVREWVHAIVGFDNYGAFQASLVTSLNGSSIE